MKTKAAIGIDIGGTNTEIALVDIKGNCHLSVNLKTKTFATAEKFADAVSASIKYILSESPTFNVKGVGIGAPNGNILRGTIEFAPNLRWKGVIKLATMIQKRSKLNCILTNDANAAALGEMMFGAAKGMKDFIVITLGTGLGSGIVVNGKVLYGHDGYAGELGHTIVDPEGRQCGCGRKGCLETYASASGIVKTALELIKKPACKSLLKKIPKAELDSESIHHAALKGDKTALQAFDYTAKILGLKLSDAVAFSSPEAIILFGGLAKSGKLIIAPTKKYLEQNLLPIYRNKVKILPSGVTQNAAVLGAASLILG